MTTDDQAHDAHYDDLHDELITKQTADLPEPKAASPADDAPLNALWLLDAVDALEHRCRGLEEDVMALVDGNMRWHLTALKRLNSPKIPLRVQPCGCVICMCEDESRCHGCGAKLCHNPGCDVRLGKLVYETKAKPPADALLAEVEALCAKATPDGNETADYAYELKDALRLLAAALREAREQLADTRRQRNSHQVNEGGLRVLLTERDQQLQRSAIALKEKDESIQQGEKRIAEPEAQIVTWRTAAHTSIGKCATCDGDGIMTVMVGVEAPTGREIEEMEPCGECLGTGRGDLARQIELLREQDKVRIADLEAEVSRVKKQRDDYAWTAGNHAAETVKLQHDLAEARAEAEKWRLGYHDEAMAEAAEQQRRIAAEAALETAREERDHAMQSATELGAAVDEAVEQERQRCLRELDVERERHGGSCDCFQDVRSRIESGKARP